MKIQRSDLDLAKVEIGEIIHALGALGCHRGGILSVTGGVGALRHAGRAGAAAARRTGAATAAAAIAAALTVPIAAAGTTAITAIVPAAIAAGAAVRLIRRRRR